MFAQLVGQEKIKHYFSRVINSGMMPHGYLFYGPRGVGKTAASLELAQIITCHDTDRRPCGECVSCVKFRNMEHPDVLLFFPVPGSTKPEEFHRLRIETARNPYKKIDVPKNGSLHIDMIRDIKRRLRLQSYQGHGRVIILLNCEKITPDSGNALLKILEEPPQDVSFILTTSVLDDVPPTVRSRCQLLHMSYLSTECIADALQKRMDIPEKRACYFAHLSGGSFSRALEFFQDDFSEMKEYCERILEFCSSQPYEELIALVETIVHKFNSVEIKSMLELLVELLKHCYEYAVDSNSNSEAQNLPIKLPASLLKKSLQTIESVICDIEKSVDLLNKNVYINLILNTLLFKLSRVLRDG